jgi:hypothetical protein
VLPTIEELAANCHLLPKNMKTKINKIGSLPIVLYGCETTPLSLKKNIIRRKPHEDGENYIMRSFIIITSH